MYVTYASALAAPGEPAQLTPAIRARIAGWLTDAGFGEVDLGDDGRIGLRNLSADWRVDDAGQLELALTATSSGGSTTTRVHVAVERHKVRVVTTVERRRRGQPQPPPLAPPPKVVADLLVTSLFADGGIRMCPDATVIGPDDVTELVDELRAPNRRYPVLVFSEPPDSPLAVHDRAVGMLAGQAHIRVLGGDATWRLSAAVGNRHSCFGGAARIYWRLDGDTDPDGNRYWARDALRVDHERIFGWLRHRLTAAVAASLPDVGPVARTRGQVAVDEGSRAEVDAIRDQVAALERDLAAAESALDDVGRDNEFSSTGEAVQAASRAFDDLVWLPEALESAAASPYRNPDRAYAALGTLAEAAARWKADALHGGFAAFFAQSGIRYGMDVSVTARNRWPSDYRRRWRDREIWLGPHLKLGSGPPANHCRIYWYVDSETRNIVVGHVGVHLTDTATEGG